MTDQIRPEIARTITLEGVATNYHDVGQGDTVLLIHGSGPGVTAWANWRLTMDALAARFRIVAPDMLGFGYTDAVEGGIRDKQVWVDHLVELLDALELERVSVVGNSFGGAIAIAFAVAHPERVHRLALMGAVGTSFPITPGLDFVWGYTPSLENMRTTLGYLSAHPERLSEDLIRSRFEASDRPGAQAPYQATFGPGPRQQHIEMLASADEEITGIRHETMLLHGVLDQVIPVDVSYRLHQLIPNADLHVFNGCGHWVQIERATTFNNILSGFLADGLA